MSAVINPCISCGACCAYFRVSFYWSEAASGQGSVPDELTEKITPFMSCMSGTNSKSPRCDALRGEVGQPVSCAIYPHRPTPCREFTHSGDNAVRHESCDRARAHYGLPPLPVEEFERLPAEEISSLLMTGSHSGHNRV
ncbi:putative zinc-/iron-chelating domain protein [Yersinia ruckeri]|uniref:YkgJ family cysteine cluster protein n=1 Tax=Yersinia ruckeri TaxID=29486 RepID=UPI0005AD1A8B|nr:YkgJ family cysteine cluster protein [Yersinia ruckeri]AJI96606.1 putative zinc-/iron-chelating domain protein [Yersinia ruckeri]MCW6567319.1 YkgJ family cysteine cluster protein [Yersinia ruckeri]